ncbi:MAG TPA: PEGA domain-containing protein [Tepidisphaeraceae bacterium]
MNRSALWVVLLGLACCGTGCATLRGDKQKVKFETDPSAATLTVDDRRYTTPAEVELKRKDAHRVTVEKPGYVPLAFNLQSTWDGASMTDVALPGGSALFGLSVATGSDLAFNNLATIKLQKAAAPNPPVLEVYQYRGTLLTKSEYDKAIADERANTSRFMGGNE